MLSIRVPKNHHKFSLVGVKVLRLYKKTCIFFRDACRTEMAAGGGVASCFKIVQQTQKEQMDKTSIAKCQKILDLGDV